MRKHDTQLPYVHRRARLGLCVGALAAACVAMVFLSLCLGSARISLEDCMRAIVYRVTGREMEGTAQSIIFAIRLPRALLAWAVGAALSVSGVAMQGVFKNPMAEPHILGVSSGAALGAGLVMLMGVGSSALGLSAVSLGALLGGLGAAAVVMSLSGVGSRGGTVNLLLSGVAVGTFLTAMLSGLLTLNHEKMEAVYSWTMGSFTSASFGKLQVLLPVLAAGTALLLVFARDLNAMLFGDEEARALGVPAGKVRAVALFASTLVTATAVSVSGVIGFVGLMVPHTVRLAVGADHRAVLPVSFFAGGLYLMIMDMLARTLFMPAELPVGVLTALVGGPFFLVMLKRARMKAGGMQ